MIKDLNDITDFFKIHVFTLYSLFLFFKIKTSNHSPNKTMIKNNISNITKENVNIRKYFTLLRKDKILKSDNKLKIQVKLIISTV